MDTLKIDYNKTLAIYLKLTLVPAINANDENNIHYIEYAKELIYNYTSLAYCDQGKKIVRDILNLYDKLLITKYLINWINILENDNTKHQDI